jgi:rhamnose transport system permease protein
MTANNNLSKSRFINLLKSWEFIIFLVLLVVFFVDYLLSPTLFQGNNMIDATAVFMEKSILALALVFIIITGYIDISIAAIVAMSGVVLGISYQAGYSLLTASIFALLTGTAAGFINGFFCVKVKVPSIVVTLSGLILYRGIAYILTRDSTVYLPEEFNWIGGYYKNFPMPTPLIIFIVLAIIVGVVLHFTTFGRQIYAIGNNENAARYSGVPVDKIRILLYTFMGFISGLVGILLTSRIGSARPDIAGGMEMQVIAIVLLGGVYIFGGKGSIIGVILAAFVIGYIFYGMAIINIQAQVISIVTGLVLIISLVIPTIIKSINESRQRKLLGLKK